MKRFALFLVLLVSVIFSSQTALAEALYIGTTPFYLNKDFYPHMSVGALFTDIKNDQGTSEGLWGESGYDLYWGGGRIQSHNDSFWYNTNDPLKAEIVITYFELTNRIYDSAGPTPRSLTANFNWSLSSEDREYYISDEEGEGMFTKDIPVSFISSFSLDIGFVVIPELEEILFVLPYGVPDYTATFESNGYQYTMTLRNDFSPLDDLYAAYAREAFGLEINSVVYGSTLGLGVWLDVAVTPPSSPTPEPATVLLMGAGLFGMRAMRKRFKG